MADEEKKNEDQGTESAAQGGAGQVKKPKLIPIKARETGAPASPAGSTKEMTRRGLFSALGLGWLTFAGATAAASTAMLRFMFPNVVYEPPSSFRAGYPSDYTVGAVETRYKAKYAVWIVRDSGGMYVLSTICTHLGCTPNWLEAEQKFKCPCHGSGFKKTGINFEGPAPRPLERFAISLADDGEVLIDKSRKFQYEKGQWSDPAAYLKLA